MSANIANSVFYPQITSLPSSTDVGQDKDTSKLPGEFGKIFDQAVQTIDQPVKFSAHAVQRLNQRSIPMDQSLMVKVKEGVEKAASKGIEEGLILTDDAAFIVNVKNRMVITAMDKSALSGNVFTNIDGAVIV